MTLHSETERLCSSFQATDWHGRMMETFAKFSEFETPWLIAESLAYTLPGHELIQAAYEKAVALYLEHRAGDLLAHEVVASWIWIDDEIKKALSADLIYLEA